MAFSTAPTLCEVTYDISEEEKRYTPFRYQCRSAPARQNAASPTGNSEVTNYSLPSGLTVTYYEYLRSLYDSRIQSANVTRKRAQRHSSAHPTTGSHIIPGGVPGEIGFRHRGRPTTALPYVSPNLPILPQYPGGVFEEEHERFTDDRLVWVDALNKWVPEHQLNSRPYVSFVGTAPTVDKLYTSLREQQRSDGIDLGCCERYDEHMKLYEQKAKQMGMVPKLLEPEHSFIKRIMALRKKEALRKKAAEQLEQRRQRRSHSSPTHPPNSPRNFNEDMRVWHGNRKLTTFYSDKSTSTMSTNKGGHKVRFEEPRSPKVSPLSPRASVVKEEQDFDKAWNDEANTEDLDKQDEDSLQDAKESSSCQMDKLKTDGALSSKALEKSQSEIDREKAKELLASLAAKNKKEKHEVVQHDKELVSVQQAEPRPPPPPSSNVQPVVISKEEVAIEAPPILAPPTSGKLPVIPLVADNSLPTPPLPKPKGVKWSDQIVDPKKVKKAPKKETEPKTKDVKPSRPKKTHHKVKTKNKDNGREEMGLDLDDPGTLISEDTLHSIATIEDTKTGPLSLTLSTDKPPESPSPPPQSRKRSVVKKTFVPKVKSKVDRQDSTPTPESVEDLPPPSHIEEEVETVARVQVKEPELPVIDLEEPPLPDPLLHKCEESKTKTTNKVALRPMLKLDQKLKKIRHFKKDTSYEDELRRQEEAERRRQKQMEMMEKMRNRNRRTGGDAEAEEEARKFENYGFLAKYCIFNRHTLEAYKRTFESVDDDKKGWIQGIDVMIALRGINQNISYEEEEYLYRVMEITGYNISQGADFKLFAVMAALSLKISALDSWMKNMIGSMDFKTLDTKMYMCKKLWECNVDPDTNTISLDQLCIELRAGGISPDHELEVREKLGHLKALDLLDFLTYIPLFIMIHESVVDNPFDERRDK